MILPQFVTVGIYDSKVVARNIAVSKVRKTSMFEIELPIDSGGISYIDDGSKPITPGILICAKPGQHRHTKFPFKCYYVHIILSEGALYDLLMNTPDFVETENSEKYKALFERMIRHFTTPAEHEQIILQSLLLELLYTISKDSGKAIRHDLSPGSRRTVEQALRYIKENLTEELSLEKVASAVSVSPNYFHSLFRTSVGKTLREYIEDLRIKKAVGLLLTTSYSLTRIAFECGFSSQSYFSFVFKRKMGITPRQYVKQTYGMYEI